MRARTGTIIHVEMYFDFILDITLVLRSGLVFGRLDFSLSRRSVLRFVQAAAWAMGSCAIVAVEENDRVVALKVGEQAERRECAGRNPERRRRPAPPR